jgi:hemolysin D
VVNPIKSFLLIKDVGFVAKDMVVSIKIDTFNFQKYGTLDGKSRYPRKVSRTNSLVWSIALVPYKLSTEGIETSISAGMSVTPEVKFGKRRTIEFSLHPPIKFLDEGVSVM